MLDEVSVEIGRDRADAFVRAGSRRAHRPRVRRGARARRPQRLPRTGGGSVGASRKVLQSHFAVAPRRRTCGRRRACSSGRRSTSVRREGHVRLELVVVLRQIDEPLGRELAVGAWREQVDPLAVAGAATLRGPPPSPANSLPSGDMLKCTDQCSRGDRVPRASCPDVDARRRPARTPCYCGVCRSYQIVLPSAPKNSWPAISMSIVRLCISLPVRAVGADRPDAVDLVPRPFVAEHDQRRVGRRQLHVIQPVGRLVDDPFSSPVLTLSV